MKRQPRQRGYTLSAMPVACPDRHYLLPTALLSHFHLKTRALDISRFFESSIIGCQTCKFAVKSSRCFYPPLFNLSLPLPISSVHCLLPSVFNFRSHDLSIPIILDRPCLPQPLSHTHTHVCWSPSYHTCLFLAVAVKFTLQTPVLYKHLCFTISMA